MIDARDLSYKLLDLWREVMLQGNNAASIAKNAQPVPVYIQDEQGNLKRVTSTELTSNGIILKGE